LGRHAFKITLARRPHKFGLVLKQLDADLKVQTRLHIPRREQVVLQAVLNSKENAALDRMKF
jgi:hypothetical protein